MTQGSQGSFTEDVLVPAFIIAFYLGALAFVLEAAFGGGLFSALDLAGWLFVISLVVLFFALTALAGPRRRTRELPQSGDGPAR